MLQAMLTMLAIELITCPCLLTMPRLILLPMVNLPENICSHFFKGGHTVGLTSGRMNRIWTDQTIESTTMERGHNATS